MTLPPRRRSTFKVSASQPAQACAERLRAALAADAGRRVSGEVGDGAAWLRPRALLPLRPPTLRLSLRDVPGGAEIACRFEPGAVETFDLPLYGLAGVLGLGMIGLWVHGDLGPAQRQLITDSFPAILAGLVAVVVAQYAWNARLQAARDRVFAWAAEVLGLA